MAQARDNDTVKVHYTGKLEDGTVFDSSVDRDPIQFTIGAGQVIAGFERAVTGMEPGETKTATLAPDEAYGPRREEMVSVVDRSQLPDDLELRPGQQLAVKQQDGRQFTVTVTELTDSTVTVDANHALAGKRLTFDLQLVAIV